MKIKQYGDFHVTWMVSWKFFAFLLAKIDDKKGKYDVIFSFASGFQKTGITRWHWQYLFHIAFMCMDVKDLDNYGWSLKIPLKKKK